MSMRFENRSTYSELIDDLVDTPSTTTFSHLYSSVPGSLNQFDRSTLKLRERKRDLSAIIKQLYEGKLLPSPLDEQVSSPENSNFTSTRPMKEEKTSMENLDFVSIDGDVTTLQRELKEKELDILHLRKEIQELQVENKSLRSKNPHSHFEGDSYRREREVLQHELRSSHELIAKLQQQNRANQIDETILQEKESAEKRLKTFEKQMKSILNENERFKQSSQQSERTINQLRKENEDLQMKLTEAKKKNDELFYQEFHSLRNDLKMVKQKNNELFEENLRLQKPSKSNDQSDDRGENRSHSYRSKSTDHAPPIKTKQSPEHQESLTQPSVPTIDIQDHDDEEEELLDDSKPTSVPHHVYRSEFQHQTRSPRHQDPSDGGFFHPFVCVDQRSTRRAPETISPRRPYAPTTTNDIHLNDLVKFSRPGGKISKGIVKYIGLLPEKNEQYLGLELEVEESKHDGVYQDQRYFQCKPNKGVFVAFSKVIMAWSVN